MQDVWCLVDGWVPRARLNKFDCTDFAFCDITLEGKILWMEIELCVNDELRLRAVGKFGNLPPVFALNSDRFFNDCSRHPVFRGLVHQRVADAFVAAAEHGRGNDVQEVGFLLRKHFVEIGIPSINTELIAEIVEQIFLHVANSSEFATLDVLICACVPTGTSSTP